MNNLLCKAKRFANNQWVEGYLIPPNAHYDKDSDSYRLGWKIRYVKDTIVENGKELVIYDDCIIKINTLCRCTGLKDKNDNLIWENSICKSDNKHIVKIIWNRGMRQWQVKICKTDYCLIRDLKFPLWQWDAEEIKKDFRHKDNPPQILEVIGNTIDNPELLEV